MKISPLKVLAEVDRTAANCNDNHDLQVGTLDGETLELSDHFVWGPSDDVCPRWMPDESVYFITRTHQNDDASGPLNRVMAPGEPRRRIIDGDVSSYDITAKEDRLAFVLAYPREGRPNAKPQLWLSRPDGSGAREVPLPKGFEPQEVAFAPNGRCLFFTTRQLSPDGQDDHAGLYSYDLGARRLKRHTGWDAFNPVVSPDGRRVVYTTESAIRALDLRTQRDWALRGTNADGPWTRATLSPDGGTVYYANGANLMSIPIEGGVPRCIASGVSGLAFPTPCAHKEPPRD